MEDGTAKTVLINVISSGTGEFIEEYLEQMLSPVIENLSFDGEEFTFKENPIQVVSSENLYAGFLGLIFGGTYGGVETANKLNAAKLNTTLFP